MEARTPAALIASLAAVLAAMVGFQVGAALSKGLFPAVGPEGAAAIRLALAAPMLLALARPWRAWPRAAPWIAMIGLGLSSAAAMLFFYLALARLPQGIAIALQFLGPLAIALAGSRRPADLVWALFAAAGVWGLVGEGASGARLDPVGIAFALAAAGGWAGYILFGRVAGRAFGASAAAFATTIAALVIVPFGAAHAGTALLSPALLPLGLAVALFATALPFSLELYAMPRIPARTFAVFTSLEPGLGALSGLVLLHERLGATQICGLAAVIAAAAGAGWSSAAKRPRGASADASEIPLT